VDLTFLICCLVCTYAQGKQQQKPRKVPTEEDSLPSSLSARTPADDAIQGMQGLAKALNRQGMHPVGPTPQQSGCSSATAVNM
jgi:hypothetical protein